MVLTDTSPSGSIKIYYDKNTDMYALRTAELVVILMQCLSQRYLSEYWLHAQLKRLTNPSLVELCVWGLHRVTAEAREVDLDMECVMHCWN